MIEGPGLPAFGTGIELQHVADDVIRIPDALSDAPGLSDPSCRFSSLRSTQMDLPRRMRVSTQPATCRIRLRKITDADKDAAIGLLVAQFPGSEKSFWRSVFERLAQHPAPVSLPKYGYLMETELGEVVGIVLMISSTVGIGNARMTKCNLSSWCIAPPYRWFAHSFISRVLKNHDLTYVNISPSPHTLPLIRMHGFHPFCAGQFCTFTLPLWHSMPVEVVAADARPSARFEASERELLQTHAECGCLSLWCMTSDGAHPFVFRYRLFKGLIPYAQLIYCRSIEEFVRFAKPIGRFLARRGRLFITLDANGPIPGLVGRYCSDSCSKFYRGPSPPRLGDLAYTESALFGV
jgi:hypothetical protein